jgi:putative PIG3 family NAD(P)H quinone oxidoreductase
MAKTKMMTAIAIREPGGPEMLVAEARPVPVPGAGELLIAIAAAGINRADVMQRKGHYPPPPGAPDIPGLEVSGVVAEVGRGVSRFKVGDQVVALLTGGGYAEFCVAHEATVLPLPEPLTLVEGGGVPEAAFTVWHNVFQRGSLRPGEWLLMHGGTSGLGTTAIQLAKAFGAFVAVTAGSEEKCEAARSLGADLAINYKTEDFVPAIREATGGRGADVIMDMVGGDYLKRNLDAAAEDGRVVQISTMSGATTEIDLRKIMGKRLTLTGSTLRNRPLAFKEELARVLQETVWPLIASGRYRPIVDKLYPLSEAALAHRRMESSEHVGKIILTVSD